MSSGIALFFPFGEIVLDHQEEMIFLDHMIVNRLVAWVGVVDFNQDVVEYVPSP